MHSYRLLPNDGMQDRDTNNQKSPMTAALPSACNIRLPAANGGDALEHETVAAILSYRHYLGLAQRRFERLSRLSDLHLENAAQLIRASASYRIAVEKLDNHERRLTQLIEWLGYVPKCDRKQFH